MATRQIHSVLLNVAGGEHGSDLDLLRRDKGVVRRGLVPALRACAGLSLQERPAKLRRMEKFGEAWPGGMRPDIGVDEYYP